MDLSNNNFEQMFPKAILLLTRLEVCDLSYNKFYGEVDSGIGDLEKLRVLILAGNDFHSELPGTIAVLKLSFLNIEKQRGEGFTIDGEGSLEHLEKMLGKMLPKCKELYV